MTLVVRDIEGIAKLTNFFLVLFIHFAALGNLFGCI